MKDATKYANDIAKKENDDALEAIAQDRQDRDHVLTPQQKEEWRQTLLPVHKEVEGRIGKDLIQQVYATTGFGGAK